MPDLWYGVATRKRKAPSYTGRKEEENRSAKTQIIEQTYCNFEKNTMQTKKATPPMYDRDPTKPMRFDPFLSMHR